MSENLYNVGEVLPLNQNGKQIGTIKVVKVYPEDGKTQVEYTVLALTSGYSGPFKVGSTFKCAEDEYVGTFENPPDP